MIRRMYPSSNEGEEQYARKESADIWENLLKLLPDTREQRLAFLLFNCGLNPREIVSHCPQEFCDVQEIYRLRSSIIGKFLCNGGL